LFVLSIARWSSPPLKENRGPRYAPESAAMSRQPLSHQKRLTTDP
jgi:hypothetical protein